MWTDPGCDHGGGKAVGIWKLCASRSILMWTKTALKIKSVLKKKKGKENFLMWNFFFFPARRSYEPPWIRRCESVYIPAFLEGRCQLERGVPWAPDPGKMSLASFSRRVVRPLLRMSEWFHFTHSPFVPSKPDPWPLLLIKLWLPKTLWGCQWQKHKSDKHKQKRNLVACVTGKPRGGFQVWLDVGAPTRHQGSVLCFFSSILLTQQAQWLPGGLRLEERVPAEKVPGGSLTGPA